MRQPGSRRSLFSRLMIGVMKTETAHRAVSWLAARYMRFVFRTTRWTYDGVEVARQTYLVPHRRLIVLLWHNRIGFLPLAWQWREPRCCALVSEHRDGRLYLKLTDSAGMAHIGIPAKALGLREKDVDARLKRRAVQAIKRAVERGDALGIAADGTTGPRFVLKPFAVELARVYRTEIALFACAVKRRIVLRSWDRMIVPLPFNRGIFRWSTSTYETERGGDESVEALRARIEVDLRSFTDEADRMMGHAPIE